MAQPQKLQGLRHKSTPNSKIIYIKNIAIAVINVVLFCFAIITGIINSRETQIVSTEESIKCEIIQLDCTSTSRHHPTALVSYNNRSYNVGLKNCNGFRVGRNVNDFYYDSLLDRIFVRKYGTNKIFYLSLVLFAISLLLWYFPKDKL